MLLVYFSTHTTLALILVALVLLLCVVMAYQASRSRIRGGNEELVGMYGEVTDPSNPKGKARALIRGETWQVYSDQPLEPGQMIKVIATHGLLLDVEPVATQLENDNDVS